MNEHSLSLQQVRSRILAATAVAVLGSVATVIGTPDTVEKKILSLYEMCGGFGTLLSLVYDNADNQKGWEKSMKLLAEEVMPRFAGLNPD